MNITKIDKVACNVIREKFESKMAELQDELGLTFTMKSITYAPDGDSCSFKVDAVTQGSTPQTVKDYNRYVGILELPILGTRIRLNGIEYKTSGFKAKARKNNILIEACASGKEYVITTATLKRNIIT